MLRAQVRDELAAARRQARDDGRNLALLVSCLDPAALEPLLPDGSPVAVLHMASALEVAR